MLYIAPVSIEVFDAIHIVATNRPGKLGMCASTSQVGDKTYTGITYERLRSMRSVYPVHVPIERDHLGRNGEDMNYWIARDINHGFDQVMLHVFDPHDALPILQKWTGHIKFQVGPGEDCSRPIVKELFGLCAQYADSISFPTGCLIDCLFNKGEIREDLIDLHRQWGVKIRGHNCDYLPVGKLQTISRLCDAINVAPQLGVMQSLFYLEVARLRGLCINEWEKHCHADGRNQQRWCKGRPDLAVQAVGHYHYDKIPWRQEWYPACVNRLRSYINFLLDNTYDH